MQQDGTKAPHEGQAASRGWARRREDGGEDGAIGGAAGERVLSSGDSFPVESDDMRSTY